MTENCKKDKEKNLKVIFFAYDWTEDWCVNWFENYEADSEENENWKKNV